MSSHDDHVAECWCHYWPNLIVIRAGDESAAIDQVGGRQLDEGGLCRLIDGVDGDIIRQVGELIGVVEIEDADPHGAANALNAAGIDASPVHGMGFLGHGGFQGSAWTESDTSLGDVDSASDAAGFVAVVDSGIVPDDDLPPWMTPDDVRSDRPVDTEHIPYRDPISHGTFVTSIVRRVTPEHVVSLASARPDPGHLVSDDPAHEPARPPTDELNVLGAVLRLLNRHGRSDRVRAMCMALGVHVCPGDAGQRFLALEAAVEAWTNRFPKAPIFAAAGNSQCPEPLYPAEFTNVRSVAAACEGEGTAKPGAADGRIVVWDHGSPVPAPSRPGVTDVGPGCDVTGLSGQSEDHTVSWGGSSFATAIVAACHAKGTYNPVSDGNGVQWWPDLTASKSRVDGL
ncbi:MAG: S8/S53 family peptidase [Acidimicrobiia bacterium]